VLKHTPSDILREEEKSKVSLKYEVPKSPNPPAPPSPIASITKPKCTIRNISHNTDSKIYHLSGMEDYESTVIDAAREK
jgi:hypothetical protein